MMPKKMWTLVGTKNPWICQWMAIKVVALTKSAKTQRKGNPKIKSLHETCDCMQGSFRYGTSFWKKMCHCWQGNLNSKSLQGPKETGVSCLVVKGPRLHETREVLPLLSSRVDSLAAILSQLKKFACLTVSLTSRSKHTLSLTYYSGTRRLIVSTLWEFEFITSSKNSQKVLRWSLSLINRGSNL